MSCQVDDIGYFIGFKEGRRYGEKGKLKYMCEVRGSVTVQLRLGDVRRCAPIKRRRSGNDVIEYAVFDGRVVTADMEVPYGKVEQAAAFSSRYRR